MKDLRNLFEGIFDAEDILSKSIEYIPHLDIAPLGLTSVQKLFNNYASDINDTIYLTGAQQILVDVQEKLNLLGDSVTEYNNIHHPNEPAFSRSASVELQTKLGFMQNTIVNSMDKIKTDSILVKNLDWFKERYTMIYSWLLDLHKKFPEDFNAWINFNRRLRPTPQIIITFEPHYPNRPLSELDEVWEFAKKYKFSIKPTIKVNDELKSLIWK